MNVTELGALTLPSHTGELTRLGDTWQDRPVVVAFLRHFGCSFCREFGIVLSGRYEEIQSKGAEVIAIGTGDVKYAKHFAEEEGIPFPVLVDDDGAAARAASVRKVSLLRLVTDRRMFAAGKAGRAAGTLPPLKKSQKIGKRVNQLAATFVIGPGDKVLFAHYSEHGGDHVSVEDLIGAIPVSLRP